MKLYVFTATFPHGKRESFLEDEITYLCKAFESVIIVPLSARGPQTRKVPNNCVVITPIIHSRFQQYTRGLFCFKSISLYAKDFFEKKVFLNTKRLKQWFISMVLTNNLLKSKDIKALFDNIKEEDVCYFYWGKGSNPLAAIYRGKCHFVSRFHGEWDLWEESSGNYAPIRKQISDSLDFAAMISKKGEYYFKQRYPGCKTYIFPLGSRDGGICKKSEDGVVRVVSCSSVYYLKRVSLIMESLQNADKLKIEWTHIGDGVDFEEIKRKAESNQCKHLTIHLLGRLKHDDVIKYYQNHPVDAFINLSTNEGVPVAIMEAISFNIPVIATNVGSTSEIVTEETGKLVGPNPIPVEVAEALYGLLNSKLNPRAFWENHYNAEKNYSAFANKLLTINQI